MAQTANPKIKRALVSVSDKEGIVDFCSSLSNDFGIEIISTGGTGLTGRDVTVEAHNDLYEKKINAFEILFTKVSIETIGTSAIQSRACAGVASGTFLFALPGSPSACKDAWDKILCKQFDYRNLPCNFVEILPRLEEHKKRK